MEVITDMIIIHRATRTRWTIINIPLINKIANKCEYNYNI